MGKVRRNMGFSMITVAFFFLFNPNISVVDISPDFIGYILIVKGLSCLYDINGYMDHARSLFKKAALVSTAEFISFFVLFGMVQPNEKATSYLLFPIIFAVLKLVLLIPAYKSLFLGMNYLGTRLGGTAVFESKKRKKGGKTVTEAISSFTMSFLAFKSVMSFVPELSSLTSYEYFDSYATVDWYKYIGLYRSVSFVAVLSVGIVWLVKIVKYFNSVKRDRAFVEAIENKYRSEILTNENLFTRRRVCMGLIIIGIGAFTCVDLYINRINILPDLVAAGLWIWAYATLKKEAKHFKLGILFNSFFALSSIFKSVVEGYFFGNYTLTLVYKSADAYYSYILMQVAAIIENISFILAAVSVFMLLRDVINLHTGHIYTMEHSGKMNDDLHRELRAAIIPILVFTVISAACGIAYVALLYGHMLINEIMWMIDLVFGVAFALVVLKGVNEITENVKSRYLLA